MRNSILSARRRLMMLALAVAAPSLNGNKISFVDEAPKVGLTRPILYGGERDQKYLLESTGTGVAVIDYGTYNTRSFRSWTNLCKASRNCG